MQVLLAASLAALSLSPPVLPDEPAAVQTAPEPKEEYSGRAWKFVAQAIYGAGGGMLAGGTIVVLRFGPWCGWDAPAGIPAVCGNDAAEDLLLMTAPLAFAAGEAVAVYATGHKFDGAAHGSFRVTLAGAVLGTALGAGVRWAGDNEPAFAAAGIGVATAATMIAYDRSRPRTRAAEKGNVTVVPTFDSGGHSRGAGLGLRVAVVF